MPQQQATARLDPQTLSAVTKRIVQMHAEHFGKGPTRARTERLGEDAIVLVMRDTLTPVERTLIARGQADPVQSLRRAFQRAMGHDFTAAVEELVGCRVRAFMSEVHIDPDISVEMFFLDRDGGGA